MKYQIMALIGLSVFCNLTFSQESSGENNTVDNLSSQQQVISSPLLDEYKAAGSARLNSLAYKASSNLYPVKIVSINEFPIKHLLHGYEYQLLPGTYVIVVQPDFSLLNEVTTLMNNTYASKKVEINLSGNKQYSLGARINATEPESWQLEFYGLQPFAASQ